jgi:ketosteroid isomerase-like protein
LSVGALADSTTKIEKQLSHEYELLHQAFRNQDTKAFNAFYAPGFTASVKGQVTDRDHLMRDMDMQMKIMKVSSWTAQFEKLTVTGSDVAAKVHRHLVGSVPKGMDGKPHTFELQSDVVDHWSKKSGHWLLTSSEALTMSAMMDGHKMGGPR